MSISWRVVKLSRGLYIAILNDEIESPIYTNKKDAINWLNKNLKKYEMIYHDPSYGNGGGEYIMVKK